MSEPNSYVLMCLRRAIDSLVAEASNVEGAKSLDNPNRYEIADALDSCTDELRDLEYELTK